MRRWSGLLSSVAVVAFVLVVLRVGVVLPEQCPSVSPEEARASVEQAVGWFDRNQHTDGSWLYLYDGDEHRDLGGYNIVRHAGVMVALYQSANVGVDGALDVGDRGLEFVEDHLVAHDDWRAFGYDDSLVDTGASALLVSALVERKQTTGDDRNDDLARDLGRFLVAQTDESGAVSAAWDPDTGAAVPDEFSIYFTGESAWALARLHVAFPDEGWDASAQHIARYLPTRDDREDRFPPTPDHWAAYTYAELDAGGQEVDTDQRAHAERLAGIFGIQVRVESQRWQGGWAGFVRGGGPASASGLGTLGEGSAALWRLLGGEGAPGVEERIRCVAGMLVERQAAPESDPAVGGAWFTDGLTRMDDQQHAVSALLGAEPVLAAGGDTTGGGADAHGFLWVLVAFLATANPARLPVPKSRRIAVATVTGAVAAVVGLTALATPLLDALDVSPATARIAAGAVVAAAAVIAMVWPTRVNDGLLAAAGIVFVISVGADDGVWPATIAALIVALVAVALPTRWRTAWVSRPLAAISLAVAVDLIVDGILGI